MRSFRFAAAFFLTGLVCATAQITLNPSPTRVIGQTSTTLFGVSPNLVEGREFQQPSSVVVDGSTSPAPVYVSDTGNNRVLGFRSATGFTNGQFADIVIGQPDFVTTFSQGPTNTSSTRSTGLTSPRGLAVDNSGNLYVIDAGNNRILRFPKPFTQTANELPDMVIGQPGFSTGGANQGGISASTLSFAGASSVGLTFDSAGNLWVADSGNNRVLRFNASALGAQPKSNPSADVVLGQGDFVSGTTATAPAVTSLTAIHAPTGIAFDSTGRLFVSDSVASQRGRILVWFPPFSTGQSATRMLGVDQNSPQPPLISEFQLQQSPGALFAVGNQIGVADTYNNRLLLYPPVEQWNQNNFFQSAVTVVGQTSFSTGAANQGGAAAGASTLANPTGTFFYNSELYAADTNNHRMIVMPQSGSGFGPGTRVLGQLQLNLNTVNLIQGREFNFSSGGDAGIAVDFSSAVPHLYVADTYNNRVLGFYDLRNIQPGQYADIVIGQPDFLNSISNYPNSQPTSNNLSNPAGVLVDSTGNLYVADTGNGRVLRFPSPFASFQPGTPQAITESADLVLGQLNFTTTITDATSQTMATPYGLVFDGSLGLLVSDLTHNRVLYFAGNSKTFTSGQAATLVFGQPDMNSSAAGSGLNQLNSPHHIAIDSDERLYVADSLNHRVSIFNRASQASNGSYAALALTSGLATPRGVNVNLATGDIWVADIGTYQVTRYPAFNALIGSGNYAPNATLNEFAPLAVTEDNWGNIFVADDGNRILIYYPGLSAVNAANYWGINSTPVAFPLAPNLITALYSTGNVGQFGTTAASAPAGVLPLPKQLNGVQVLVNNTLAPLFYAGQNQINFVVPDNAPQSGTADIQVIETASGRVLGDTTVAMYSVSPGIFTQTATGSGTGAIANSDGTLNTSANPATAGSIVTIYMTGQGYITGMPSDGNISNTALQTPYTPTVFIVGDPNPVPPANIKYSGLAPTLVGVWQINVQIPNDTISLPTVPVQVFVQVNGLVSGGGGLGRPVYIYVK